MGKAALTIDLDLDVEKLVARTILLRHRPLGVTTVHGLEQVWAVMNSRTLPCAPILDDDGRAQGVLYARDVAIALIEEANCDEGLLRDYVMGVGYQ